MIVEEIIIPVKFRIRYEEGLREDAVRSARQMAGITQSSSGGGYGAWSIGVFMKNSPKDELRAGEELGE